MTMTIQAALARHNITCANALIAEIEVPVLTCVQRQGDVLIIPRSLAGQAELDQMTPVGRDGVAVVRGEATGNTHLLDAVEGDVRWLAHQGQPGDLTLGTLHVGPGGVANLLHTDEHGANGIGPRTYTLRGKRQQGQEIRRVAD